MYAKRIAWRIVCELVNPGQLYWQYVIWLAAGAFLSLPEWVSNFPRLEAFMIGLDLPYWAYGLVSTAIVAIFFAYRAAVLTTPYVIPISVDTHYADYVPPQLSGKGSFTALTRVKVMNIGAKKCEDISYRITRICTDIDGQRFCTDKPAENNLNRIRLNMPLVLFTQQRFGEAVNGNVHHSGSSLNPGIEGAKNVEIIQTVIVEFENKFFILHESGWDEVEIGRFAWIDVAVSGDMLPNKFTLFVWRPHQLWTVALLAKDAFDELTLHQFCSSDFSPDSGIRGGVCA